MPQSRDTWVAIPIVMGVMGYMFWSARNAPWPPMRLVGAGMIVCGALLWMMARIQLGASFSVSAKAKTLVTHGLYSRIRNPIYVFGSVLICGLCLFYLKPLFLLVFLLIIPLQIVRARKESEVLEAAFGNAYRNYKSRTWF
ncbi:MAG TPA: isoprenylcysteine carboxylmethyltransferase family protein [Candidatus Acidoferrales bacterium]|nr:isoprenylcysteine carboxylmethyltransferase family protein [Candidatus Acidoferrales bacterium]